MTFFSQLITAVKAFFSAFGFVRKHGLWNYFLIPAVFNLVIFFVIGYLAYIYSGELIDYLSTLLEIEASSTLGGILQFFLALLIRGIVIIIYLKIYRYVMLILLSPVLALMAEKLRSLSGHPVGSSGFDKILKDAIRGAGIAFVNLWRELTLTLAILLMVFILPILAPISPIFIFLIESYYYGFSMIDYFNELRGLDGKSSRDMIWSNKGLAIGNGGMFNLFLFVPIVGVLTAPMIALTAAQLSLLELEASSPDGQSKL